MTWTKYNSFLILGWGGKRRRIIYLTNSRNPGARVQDYRVRILDKVLRVFYENYLLVRDFQGLDKFLAGIPWGTVDIGGAANGGMCVFSYNHD